MQLRLLALGFLSRVQVGIEIEYDEVGIVEHRLLQGCLGAGELPAPAAGVGPGIDSREPGMQLEGAHLSQPE